MPDRHLQRDCAAVAETEEIGLFDVQVLQQCGGVVRRLLEAERPLDDVRRVTIALLLERDDLPLARERRQDLAERRLDGVSAAMQQHERRSRGVRDAVNLEVESEAVDGSVASTDR